MPTFTLHGREYLIAPAFYMPNRMSVQACRTLHYLLQGRVCYLVDEDFPLAPDLEEYLHSKQAEVGYFDFRHAAGKVVRDHIRQLMHAGKSVVFLPGRISKIRGAITDVPSFFLASLSKLRVDVTPLFLGYYGNSIDNLYRDVPEAGCREEFCVLPRLSAGANLGERVLSAWLEKGEELLAAQPLLDSSITTLLVRSMRKYGMQQMKDGLSGATVPYYKLLGVAMAVARRLRKRTDARIGVILPPGPGGTIMLIACLLSGITPVMINYATSRSAFESTVRQAQLSCFITARAFMEKLPDFPWPAEEQIIFVEDFLKNIPKLSLLANVLAAKFAPAGWLCRAFRTDARVGEDEAVVLFTAGSTGEPKGVALTHRMLVSNISQSCCRLTLDKERFLGSLPLFHSFGLTIALLLPLIKGRPICTYPNPTDARSLCTLIEQNKLTLLCATPTFARVMLRRAEAYTFASVRYFIVGAERLQADLEREYITRCGVSLLEGYGLTEAAPVCSVNLPDEPMVQGCAFSIPGSTSRSIGQLLPGIAIRITDVDDDEKELPLSERGMIWLKGPNIFRGYINKPELNVGIFKDGWYKTGDIGRVDLNGFVTLAGRLSRFSKIGGEMVPHEGVESALCSILGLSADDAGKIAVTGVLDEQKGEALVLLSALPEHRDPARSREILSALRSELAALNLPNLWAPRELVPLENIPMLPTGKTDLMRCKQIANEARAAL